MAVLCSSSGTCDCSASQRRHLRDSSLGLIHRLLRSPQLLGLPGQLRGRHRTSAELSSPPSLCDASLTASSAQRRFLAAAQLTGLAPRGSGGSSRAVVILVARAAYCRRKRDT